jgi:CheY-like chemotaxis protein
LLPHVFELFVQGSRSRDRAEGGLGIGLTLVRSLVGLHDGAVEACSNGPGCGSEFLIRLPLLRTVEDQAGTEPGGRAVKAESLNILVVDDNMDSAEMLSVLLELEGHRVTVAGSGPAAIEMALRNAPHVALVDIGMPDMDGYELARRLGQSPELQHVVLVAITGYGQSEDIQKSRDAGFYDHLVKPVDLQLLRNVLRNLTREIGG